MICWKVVYNLIVPIHFIENKTSPILLMTKNIMKKYHDKFGLHHQEPHDIIDEDHPLH